MEKRSYLLLFFIASGATYGTTYCAQGSAAQEALLQAQADLDEALTEAQPVATIEKAIQKLKKAGGNLDMAYEGNTPLIEALTWYKDPEMRFKVVKLLVSYGASVDLAVQGTTPLIAAVLKADASVIEFLLASGANRFSKDSTGKTALMHAQERLSFYKNNPIEQSRYGIIVNMLRRPPQGRRRETQDALALSAHKKGYHLPSEIVFKVGSFVGPLMKEEVIEQSQGESAHKYRSLNKIIVAVRQAINTIIHTPNYRQLNIAVADPLGRLTAAGAPMRVTLADLQAMLTEKTIRHPWQTEHGSPKMVSVNDLIQERDALWPQVYQDYEKNEEKKRKDAAAQSSAKPSAPARGRLEDID